MFLVAGLGNPAKSTRLPPHNLGSSPSTGWPNGMASASPEGLEGAHRRGELEGHPVMLAKPQTFMNLSGASLAPLMEKHSIGRNAWWWFTTSWIWAGRRCGSSRKAPRRVIEA